MIRFIIEVKQQKRNEKEACKQKMRISKIFVSVVCL